MAQAKASGSHGTLMADQSTQTGVSDGATLFPSAASADAAAVPLDAFAGLTGAEAAVTTAVSAPVPPLALSLLGDFKFHDTSSSSGTIVHSGPQASLGNVAFVTTAVVAPGTYTVMAGSFEGNQGANGGATAKLDSSGFLFSNSLRFNFHLSSGGGAYNGALGNQNGSSHQADYLGFGSVTVLGWNSNSILLTTSHDYSVNGNTIAPDIVISDVNMASQPHSLPTDTTFTTTGPAPVLFGITVTEVPCFAAGTRIATPDGPRAVETLSEGDEVLTHGGATARLSWVGSRTVNCASHPAPAKVLPVRVRRHAFGENLPARDLLLSPDHSVYLGGVLIPICELINGQNVVQERVHTIRYIHIELPLHDIVLAENLPCESLLDIGNHSQFSENDGPVSLHPDFTPTALAWEAACAPLALHGPEVEAARALLAQRVPAALAA